MGPLTVVGHRKEPVSNVFQVGVSLTAIHSNKSPLLQCTVISIPPLINSLNNKDISGLQ